jgi:predicted ATPase
LISNLRLRNFKSVQNETEIRLKPLTIFTGPNSSGKSNIVESIGILSQIAKQRQMSRMLDFQSGLEDETAEYYKYPHPSGESIVYKGELEREIVIEIHVFSEISKRIIGYSIKHTADPPKTEQILFINRRPMFHTTYAVVDGFEQNTIEHPMKWKGKQPVSSSRYLLEAGGFLPPKDIRTPIDGKKTSQVDSTLRDHANRLVSELVTELARIYLVSAPRGLIPVETTPGPDPTWVGKNGQNLIYILSKIYGRRKYKDIQEKISNWAKRFGLGNVAAGLRKGMMLGADFEDPSLRTMFDLASASYGSRQLLTIIAEIFWSRSGDTIMIEEPEMSLHPESQVLLLELFAEAIRERKQIICTTHSSFFILSLSKAFGKKMLSKENVSLYHTEKGTEGTKTRQLDLDDLGFVKGWIPSYLKVEDELFHDWAEKIDKA